MQREMKAVHMKQLSIKRAHAAGGQNSALLRASDYAADDVPGSVRGVVPGNLQGDVHSSLHVVSARGETRGVVEDEREETTEHKEMTEHKDKTLRGEHALLPCSKSVL